MRLQDLFEALDRPRGKTAVYAFGRFNPPNPGHMRLINALKRKAREKGADWYLFISPRDPDPEKNPLSPRQKLAWLRKLMPADANHFITSPDIPMSDFAAEWLYRKGYKNAIVMHGAGEEALLFPIKQNGKTTNTKGEPSRTQYNFDSFENGGIPEPEDAAGIQGDPNVHSTQLRNLVKQGQSRKFYRLMGIDPKTKVANKSYFDTLAQAMGVPGEHDKTAK
jgi:hypothetical protein